MPKKPNFSKFFATYLKQDIPPNHQDEYLVDCFMPECENPTEHLHINCEDGTWHCKRCETSGNARTLITIIHQMYLETTTENQYLSLSEVRGINVDTLRTAGFAYDHDDDRWLVPYYTYNIEKDEWSEFLNNLGYFYPSSMSKDRYVIKKAGVLPLYLYNPGLHQYPPSELAVICEGEWDTLAYFDIFPDTEELVLGKPGSGFNNRQTSILEKSKEVHLLLDNDSGGKNQTAKCISILAKEFNDISILDWTLIDNAPKDVRDLLNNEGPEKAASLIEEAMVEYAVDKKPEKELLNKYTTSIDSYDTVPNFSQFLSTLKEHIYLNEEVTMSMAAVLGITASISIPGEPLWAFLIGPPSSGKTLFIDSFGGNNELFDNLSKISAKSLVSGWKDETNEEASYLALLRDKTLFVKDFTVTLMENTETQQQVFGLLTDIYDGYVKIPYGNNQVKEFYDLYFNMVAGVTDVVHKHSAATIGERWLRIDYLGNDYDRREFSRRALLNFGKSKVNKEIFIKNTLGFVNHMRSLPLSLEIQEEYYDPIIELAEFIATIRTKVDTDQKEGIKYKPRPELGSRLSLQLAKLFAGIRLVYLEDPDNEEDFNSASYRAFQVVKKVGINTCHGFPLDLVRTINEHPYMERGELAKKAGIHPSKAFRLLDELCITGVISKVSGRVGSRGGRPPKYFDINPIIQPVLAYDYKSMSTNNADTQGRELTRKKRTFHRPRRKG